MPRQAARTAVSLGVILDFSSGHREARISDISLSGCFIDTIVNIGTGEIITMSIRIFDDEWLVLKGEVVYVFPGTGFGVRFLDLDANEISLLEHTILMHGGNPWGRDIDSD